MLLGVSGTVGSGRHAAISYMQSCGFELLENQSADELIGYVTVRWRQNFVVLIDSLELLQAAEHRPFFLHLTLDAPVNVRFGRSGKWPDLAAFVAASDRRVFAEAGAQIFSRAHVALVNSFASVGEFCAELDRLDLQDSTRMRPSWDAYFMKLASLAAQRSNCMKRRVGCVVVRDNRVVATGYNGTPRGIVNCNEGGCVRCNTAQGSGAGLSTCLCLHAEENALLEAGRDRLGAGSVLYCNTCPCLTCTIKIVQSGIKEVIYSLKYSMDDQSAAVLAEAGVTLRQYHPPQEGLVTV